MLFHDPHALNRNSFTGEPDAPHDQWNEWDFALAEARQLIEDYTDEDGHLVFERDSDATTAVATKKINKVKAAIARQTRGSQKKPYEPSPGEYFATELKLRPGRSWPSISDWWAEEQKKRGNTSG